MATPRLQVIALMSCVGGMPATLALGAPVAQAAPPELVSEPGPVVEHARQRFEARDAAGVLAHVSEQLWATATPPESGDSHEPPTPSRILSPSIATLSIRRCASSSVAATRMLVTEPTGCPSGTRLRTEHG